MLPVGSFDRSNHRPVHLAITLLAAAIAVPILWLLHAYVRVLLLRRKLPPGPFPVPLFGNYFQTPVYKPWETWERWSKFYDNPLITIWNGHRPVIICNDAWTISDLTEKRAAIYSSRPVLVAAADIVNTTRYNQIALPYGDQWRNQRRLTVWHTITGSHAVRKHRPFHANEGKILTLDILEDPENFVHHIARYACSVVSIVGYGRRLESINDPVAKIALTTMEGVDLVIPCSSIVETIPWTQHLPKWLYAFPSKARAGSAAAALYFDRLVKEAAANGRQHFSKFLIDGQKEFGLNEGEVHNLTANLIGGGVDTTSSSIVSFIFAMCVFPEVQRKAQEEIDRVVGRERAPTWEDLPQLAYCAACTSETLRWRTVTILGGIPHAPIHDDEYRGYHIPTGTAITGNIWAIHRHAREFPAPDSFRPERYLGGLERPYPTKQGHSAFGWGRRTCSGQPFAEQSLKSVIARLLWAFDILPGLDSEGKEVTLDIFAYTSCENTKPLPFKARFVPRTDRVAEILRADAKQAREELRAYDGETRVKWGDNAELQSGSFS